MIKCAIFDLDGTLVNSIDDLGLATDYVLKQYGKEPKWTTDDYRLFVGNGAKKLVERAFEHKLSPAELEKAYEMFKEKYNEILLDHAHLYDGIKEQLDILKQKGIKIAVNSNKRGDYTNALVNKYFSQFSWIAVYGEREREGIPKKPDPSAALEIANHMNLPAEEVLYIGDSKTDMETGQNAKMDTIGVAWGFRGAEELRENNATYIVEKPEAILEYVI